MSDICLSTAAAPTYFPVHYFETRDAAGKTHTFDLIDGGVAASNPVSNLSSYYFRARLAGGIRDNYFRMSLFHI